MTRQDLYKGPISWMARNPVAANLVMVALMVGGLLTAQRMRQEVEPRVELDTVVVTVPYPGASPEEVEQGILLAVEESVRTLDGVKEVRSTASEGQGQVSIDLEVGSDRNKALADVKNAIDRITSFPEDAERPIVSLPAWRSQAIGVVLYGDLDEKTLYEVGEQTRDELTQLPEVSYLEVIGVRPLELSIEVSQENLRRYDLTLPQIAQTVRQTALDLPAGSVRTRGGEILLRTTERRDSAAEFASIPIVYGSDGTPVRLGDIAEVRDGFAQTDVWATFEGQRALLLLVYSMGDQSPPVVATTVKKYVKELQTRLPPGVHAATYLDEANIYGERLNLLLRNAMMGLALVLLILGLFLELRLAFWVTMGIPISFLGSFLLLPAFGVSLNMISLFAFIVTLGMVVDDAIVVGENTFRLRREGHRPLEAAILGAKQVATPVFFSVATTVAAFAPLLFIPGVRGKYMLCIPIIVILVLAISLFESFFILPAHLGHVPDRQNTRLGRAQLRVAGAVERFVERFYLPVVRASVRQRWIALALGVTVFATSVGLVAGGRVKTIDFPREESDWVVAVARLPYEAPVQETEQVMNRLVRGAQEAIAEHSGERPISLGVLSILGLAINAGEDGSNVTSVLVTLVPTEQRDITSSGFVEAWRKKVGEIAGLESLAFDSTTGSNSKPIDVQITHRDPRMLEAAARDLANELGKFAGLRDIDNGIELGKRQLDFTMTPAGINAGLTSADLAQQVRGAFFGIEALRQQRGRHEIRAMVRWPLADRESLHNVEELIIRTPQGGEMPLRQAAAVHFGRAYTSIHRTDGKRTVRVQADIVDDQANAQEVMQAVMSDIMPHLKAKYPGLDFGRSGRQRDMKEFLDFLKIGFLMALLAMYLLIAVPLRSYLQPLMTVMVAIPFGISGAIFGHMLMGMPLSLISMMGMVALSGVVVNDSLVLVSAANEFHRDGQTAEQAAIAAAKQRFRPVILTSVTTFGGLAPMIFETSVQARVMVPMAVSLGFGVLFSTMVVLLLVPVLYVMHDNLTPSLKRAASRVLYRGSRTDLTETREGVQ